jgi:aspartate kinase
MIDVIVQNVSAAGSTDISFTMNRDELEKIGDLVDRVATEIGAGKVSKQDGIAKLSVVGIGMRTHSGVAAKLFEALANGGINIQMISTSEIKIAVILDEEKIADAAKLAHTAFGLDAA